MIRITPKHNLDQEIALRVEGRLAGDHVALFEREVRKALENADVVRLDISHVSYADAAGVAAMQRLPENRVIVDRCSLVMSEWLNAERKAV